MKNFENIQLLTLANTLISLATAFVLGSIVGFERQYRQRTAGLRTNALVAVGAAIFVDMAFRVGGPDGGARVISYVVSGVGFLGAGAIMREGGSIRGLNTAATLWGSAAIGACEMLKKGCTASYDMFAEFPLPTVDGLHAVARAYEAVGIRAVVAPMMADRTLYQAFPALLDDMPPPLQSAAAQARSDAYAELHMHAWDCLAGLLMVREAGGVVAPFLSVGGLTEGGAVLAAAPGVALGMSEATGIALEAGK